MLSYTKARRQHGNLSAAHTPFEVRPTRVAERRAVVPLVGYQCHAAVKRFRQIG